MQFVYQSLTWGFFLVLIPLLIHLINLVRQRPVQWAAMQFLMQANKRHRHWIWLKQFLLLMARMLAIALAVAMLAHLVTQDQWSGLFGGSVTHHYVLLDDSMSMSQQETTTRAFEKGLQAVAQLANNITREETPQKFTLLRFSTAALSSETLLAEAVSSESSATDRSVPNQASLGDATSDVRNTVARVADINAQLVDSDFPRRLEESLRSIDVSQLAVEPESALAFVTQLIGDAKEERAVVYLVSDFRKHPWDKPAGLISQLQELERQPAQVQLVRCAGESDENLAIVDIRPVTGTRAAGVPLFVDIQVHNFGRNIAKDVPLAIQTLYFANDNVVEDPSAVDMQVASLPVIMIPEIKAGETVTRRAQVYFPSAGQHVVQASLPHDPLVADNQRWCVVDFPAEVPVLVIDGDAQQHNAYFLSSVFQPGQRTETGLRPSTQSVAYLRDVSTETLNQFRTIYLLDVDRLDDQARQNLTQFVRQGGGLAIFMGPTADLTFYHEWYGNGQTVFPIDLDRVDLLNPAGELTPDIVIESHPLFDAFLNQQNPLLSNVRVSQYVRVANGWMPATSPSTSVIAKLRNGQPLVVERNMEDERSGRGGRVVTVLTTLSPTWNNWALRPTFVVFLLQLQNYLDAAPDSQDSRFVGSPLVVKIAADKFRPEVPFVVPSTDGQRRVVTLPAQASDPSAATLTAQLRAPHDPRAVGTDKSGIYETWPISVDGKYQVTRYAVNIDNRESDLAATEKVELVQRLEGTKAKVSSADELGTQLGDDGRFSWSQVLMFALLFLLLGEQLLACSASYHPSPASGPGGSVRSLVRGVR